jgi:hypothetical protein
VQSRTARQARDVDSNTHRLSRLSDRRHDPHRDARAYEQAQHEDHHTYRRLRRLAWPFAAERWIGHGAGIARYSLSVWTATSCGSDPGQGRKAGSTGRNAVVDEAIGADPAREHPGQIAARHQRVESSQCCGTQVRCQSRQPGRCYKCQLQVRLFAPINVGGELSPGFTRPMSGSIP